MFGNSRQIIRSIIIFSLAFLCFEYLRSILNGYSAFWFDPARDFTLALSNLKKISLIGSPTGIPSVFYGPYWIWLISLGMLTTKDPALIIIFLQVIPYLVIFPALFFKFKKFFSKEIILALLWLFYLSSGSYIVQIWNINYAPLIFLATTYLVIALSSLRKPTLKFLCLFIIAILNALLINFHFSFGFAVSLSTVIFITISQLKEILFQNEKVISKIKNIVYSFFAYFFGFLLIETPVLLFELRHNFLQTKALVRTLAEAFLYGSAVVGQTGLKKYEILNTIFFSKPARVIGINALSIEIIYALIVLTIIYLIAKRKLKEIALPKTLTLYLGITIISISIVYTSSKNPIFDYHFAGLEIVVLLLLGIIIKNINYLKKLLYIWVFILIVQNAFVFIKYYNYVQYQGTPLWLKTAIVKTIYEDTGNYKFQTFAYSPAIYTYDYDYIFYWLGTYYKSQPSQNSQKTVYLIIPNTSKDIYYDFINYKTPNGIYKSKKVWVMIDGTTILKREKN